MDKTRLGRTNLMVTKTAFGALPIQRVDIPEATRILRRAYDAGINFFDTARGYTDSEEKIGHALADVRGSVVLATKTLAENADDLRNDIETSLKNLKTDYVDILQLHNPQVVPDRGDPNSNYAAALEAQRKGTVRFIGISNHRLEVAKQAIVSGMFDTLQFPLSAISSARELALSNICRENDVGLIAMKALCGGMLTNARAAFTFLRRYDNIVPIWGIQRMEELEEFIALDKSAPVMDDAMQRIIATVRHELSGDFCRACGYCLPCPAEIPIPMAARMRYLLRRAPYTGFVSDTWRKQMARINDCTECGQCRERCPYDLDTPRILKEMLEDYETFCTAC